MDKKFFKNIIKEPRPIEGQYSNEQQLVVRQPNGATMANMKTFFADI